MLVDQDTLDLLSQSTVLAGSFGMAKEAETIVEAITAATPDDEYAVILKATTRLNARRFGEAAKILRDEVLAQNPNNTTAKAFLALTFQLSGRQAEYEKLCQEVIDADDDEEALQLVNSLKQN